MHPGYISGEPYLIWSQLYYYLFNFNLFGHLPLRGCLRPCDLVSLKSFFKFHQVYISDTSGEITGVYKSCDKLNPKYLRSVSLGILPEKL